MGKRVAWLVKKQGLGESKIGVPHCRADSPSDVTGF